MRILFVSLIGEDIRSVMGWVMVYVHLPYNKISDIDSSSSMVKDLGKWGIWVTVYVHLPCNKDL